MWWGALTGAWHTRGFCVDPRLVGVPLTRLCSWRSRGRPTPWVLCTQAEAGNPCGAEGNEGESLQEEEEAAGLAGQAMAKSGPLSVLVRLQEGLRGGNPTPPGLLRTRKTLHRCRSTKEGVFVVFTAHPHISNALEYVLLFRVECVHTVLSLQESQRL